MAGLCTVGTKMTGLCGYQDGLCRYQDGWSGQFVAGASLTVWTGNGGCCWGSVCTVFPCLSALFSCCCPVGDLFALFFLACLLCSAAAVLWSVYTVFPCLSALFSCCCPVGDLFALFFLACLLCSASAVLLGICLHCFSLPVCSVQLLLSCWGSVCTVFPCLSAVSPRLSVQLLLSCWLCRFLHPCEQMLATSLITVCFHVSMMMLKAFNKTFRVSL